MRINADLLRQRAKDIRDALDVLDRYRRLSLEEFLSRTETVDAAKYRLLIAIEAAVSMWNHLATRLAGRTPESWAPHVPGAHSLMGSRVLSWERGARRSERAVGDRLLPTR